jgi:hypothetical protein
MHAQRLTESSDECIRVTERELPPSVNRRRCSSLGISTDREKCS